MGNLLSTDGKLFSTKPMGNVLEEIRWKRFHSSIPFDHYINNIHG